MMLVSTVEDAYEATLKDEQKLARRQSQRSRGGNSSRGKGTSSEKFQELNLKLTSNIVTMRRVEVLKKDNMEA